MSSFLSPLRIEDAGIGRHGRPVFVLLEEFPYEVGATGSGLKICVPAGFVTDFASIPRLFWSVVPPMGQHGKAAVVHDYLYRKSSGFSKILADAIFYEAMELLGVPWYRRWVMYLAVRFFGRSSYQWEDHAPPVIPMSADVSDSVREIRGEIAEAKREYV